MTAQALRPLWLLPLLLLAACSEPNADSAPTTTGTAQATLTVELVKPESGALVRELSASGSIAAHEEMQLGVELAGVRVAEVLVEVGDAVKQGQTLLTLDQRSLQAELRQAEAQVLEAEAMLAVARTALKRGNALRPKGLISVSDAEQLMANEQQMSARLGLAKASLDSSRLRVEFATLKAPADGLISARMVEPGQVVMAGAQLLRLIRDGRLEWRASLSERELGLVNIGAEVRLLCPDGAPVQGQVRKISPALDPNTRLGTVYVDLSEPGSLRAGMFASGQFSTGEAAGWTLPLSAVVLRDGHSLVYTVVEGRAREQSIQIGQVRGTRVEVISGLEPDTAVVAVGAGFLNEGDRVRVVESSTVAAAQTGATP